MINYDPHEEGNGTGGWITPPRRVRGNARRALAVPLGCVCTPLGAGGGDARPAVVTRRNAATRGAAHLAEVAMGGPSYLAGGAAPFSPALVPGTAPVVPSNRPVFHRFFAFAATTVAFRR